MIIRRKFLVQDFLSYYIQYIVQFQHYGKLSPWAWSNIRYSLLNYLQGYKTRVTTFLSKGLQNQAGYFHLDLKRPLPEEMVIPQLQGKRTPYENIQKSDDQHQVILLGSNLFNENQPSQMIRMSGFESLERLIVQSTKTMEPTEEKRENVCTAPIATDESLHEIELKAITVVTEQDTPQIKEETLLDLFDQACV